MSLHYIGMDRANKFESSVTADRRNPDLRVLTLKSYDTVSVTLTQDQLREVGKAISAETGGNTPF